MKNSKAILSAILQAAQRGQIQLRSALTRSMGAALRSTLESQLGEFDAIEAEAHAIASERGWDLSELDPMQKALLYMGRQMRIHRWNPDSKIAGILIQDCTAGLSKRKKHQLSYKVHDRQVSALSQKLLDCETAAIRRMKPFL